MVNQFDDEVPGEGGIVPSPISLAHWLEEQYLGDDRFESVDA